MKAATRLLILTAVTVLVVAATVTLYDPALVRSQAEPGHRALPDLRERVNDAARLTIAEAGRTTTLVRGESGWHLEEKHAYPAAFDRVRATLIGLTELTLTEPRTDRRDLFDRMHLEDPGPHSRSRRITVTDADDGILAELILGRQQPSFTRRTAHSYFVRVPGDSRAWLADGNLALAAEPEHWLEPGLFNLDSNRVHRVAIDQASGEPLVVVRPRPHSHFALASHADRAEGFNPQRVSHLVGIFGNLTLEDVRPASTLPAQEVLPITRVESFDGLVVAAERHRDEDGLVWVRFHADVQEAPGIVAAADEADLTESEAAIRPGTDLAPREAVDEEARAFNARLAGWAFRLPRNRQATIETGAGSVLP